MNANILIDLSQHVTCWKGSLVPSAFANLLQGLRAEQTRLNGKRFLVTLFRREFDYDGLTEYVDFIEGFNDLQEASIFADREANKVLDSGLGWRCEWQIEECDTLESLSRIRQPVDTVEQKYYRGFKLSGGSGFNSIYCHFEVLEISSELVLGEALFKYLNCQTELTGYFIEIGKRLDSPDPDLEFSEVQKSWKTKKETFLIQRNMTPITLFSGGVGLKNGERFYESAEYYEIISSGNIIKKYGKPTTCALDDELFVSSIHLVIGDSFYEFLWSHKYPDEPKLKVTLLLYGLQPCENPLPFNG